jgi:hypothetical protein
MDLNVLVWARAIERVFVCLFAGMSLVLGWNLFRVGILDPQSAQLDTKTWKLKLARVGPGVFFALFGATVLVWSVNAPLSVLPGQGGLVDGPSTGKKTGGNESQSQDQRAITYLSEQSEKERKQLALAINTVVQFCEAGSQKPSAQRTEAVRAAKDELSRFRSALVIAQFGQIDLGVYTKSIDRYLRDPGSVSNTELKVVQALEPWMLGTLPEGNKHD